MKRNGIAFWIGAALFLAAVLLMTQVVGNQYPFFAGYVILQFIALAVAWSILGGYAGYVNFGTSAFFGVGVYASVFLVKAFGAPLPLQIATAAGIGALMGFALGLLTLRKGKWADKQVLSEAWIKMATTPGTANPTYGFANFFLNTKNANGQRTLPSAPETAFYHLGNGNNMFISVSAPGDTESAPAGCRAVMLSTHCDLEHWEELDPTEYQRRKAEPNSWLSVLTRVCKSKCAPRLVHCMDCRFTKRLLSTELTADSTNAVEIVSPFRYRFP